MVAGEPAPEVRVSVRTPGPGDLVRLRVIARELQDQSVGIGDVDRAAVAVLEHEAPGWSVADVRQPFLDGRLSVEVEVESDVMKRRERHLRAELLLILGLREFEERQRAAVADLEEEVAVDSLGAEELIDLAPGGRERQPDHLLVELARGLEIIRDIGRDAGGKAALRGWPCYLR